MVWSKMVHTLKYWWKETCFSAWGLWDNQWHVPSTMTWRYQQHGTGGPSVLISLCRETCFSGWGVQLRYLIFCVHRRCVLAATEDMWFTTNVSGGFDLSDEKQMLAGAWWHAHGWCERGQPAILHWGLCHFAQTTPDSNIPRFAPASQAGGI